MIFESKANGWSKALKEFDSGGTIYVYANTLIRKNFDGTISIKSGGDFPTLAAGTGMRALIGLRTDWCRYWYWGRGYHGGPSDVGRYGLEEEFIRELQISKMLMVGKGGEAFCSMFSRVIG